MEGSHAHLIGIGGNGMRALADVLRGWGWSVSGSDSMLRGHAAENLPANADIVIHSDAIPPENPELRRAAELGISVLSYFQALGKFTAGGHTLAIAGTHGKSTTTAMIGHILAQAGRNPTVFCGAAPIGKGSGGRAGRKDFFVVEACEYRENFLRLQPTSAAILGIEPDHFDCYANLAEIEAAFRQFAESLPADGVLLYREDCPSTRKVVRNVECRKLSFGFSPTADWSAQGVHHDRGYYRALIFKHGRLIFKAIAPLPGECNLLNTLAAAALCWENGVSPQQIRDGLATFPGLHRRFEIISRQAGNLSPEVGQVSNLSADETADQSFRRNDRKPELHGSPFRMENPHQPADRLGNLSYVLDYAHHPTEVAFALKTAREVFPNRRLWCIFQPHQASRTARLLDELAFSLQNADKVIVADIFRAREGPPKPGEVTAADLAHCVAEMVKAENDIGKVIPVYQTDDILNALATQVQADDVIIVLGAGNIHEVFRERLVI